MTTENIVAGLRLARILAFIGALIGVVAAWWGLARADGAPAVALESAPLALALAVLLPVVIAYWVIKDLGGPQRQQYLDVASARTRMVTAGLAGSIAAMLMFAIATFQIPAIFGGENPVEMIDALRPLLLVPALIVIAVTLIAALTFTQWAHQAALRHS